MTRNPALFWILIVVGLIVATLLYLQLFTGGVIAHLTASNAAASSATKLKELPNVEFSRCFMGDKTNCVVDGDTFRFRGKTIRISDINAPATHLPSCQREADLGREASIRLQALLNLGPFELERNGVNEDEDGRKLRVVTRKGLSLGLQLVSEGLARRSGDARRLWC